MKIQRRDFNKNFLKSESEKLILSPALKFFTIASINQRPCSFNNKKHQPPQLNQHPTTTNNPSNHIPHTNHTMSTTSEVENKLQNMAIGQKKSWADVEEEEEGSSSTTTTTTTTSQPTTTTSAPPSTTTVAASANAAAAYEEFVAPSDVDLESLQLDASNPLFSENKKFEQFGLRDELLQGVYALRYNMPSKIQSRALPILIHEPGMNLIAQSQSGTGKTATFGLGVLQHIDETKAAVQAIIAAPSLELADQIFNVLTKLAKLPKLA